MNDTDRSDAGEFHRQYRDEQQERRKKRLPINQQFIFDLGKLGYDVVKISDYQFRVNKKIDLYPIHRRYHNLETKRRGTYQNEGLVVFIQKQIA